ERGRRAPHRLAHGGRGPGRGRRERGDHLALHGRRRHRLGVRQRGGPDDPVPGRRADPRGGLGADVHRRHGDGHAETPAHPEPDPRRDHRPRRPRQGRAAPAAVRGRADARLEVRAADRRVDEPRAGPPVAGRPGPRGPGPRGVRRVHRPRAPRPGGVPARGLHDRGERRPAAHQRLQLRPQRHARVPDDPAGRAPARLAGAAETGALALTPGRPAVDALWVLLPTGQRASGEWIDDTLAERVREHGLVSRTPLAGRFPRQRVELVRGVDPAAAVGELFERRGWTDRPPIVPPTLCRVEQMLEWSARPGHAVLGEMDPLGGLATVEKIAVNAVMAGCRPEYLPVVLAAVEAVLDPAFNLRGVQTTDENVAPLLVVNGPVARALDVNAAGGALGPGWRANATIGRALRLVMNN